MNETVEFERALDRELGMAIDAILVNAVHPIRFRPPDIERIRAATGRAARHTRCAERGSVGAHPRPRGARAGPQAAARGRPPP